MINDRKLMRFPQEPHTYASLLRPDDDFLDGVSCLVIKLLTYLTKSGRFMQVTESALHAPPVGGSCKPWGASALRDEHADRKKMQRG